MPTYVFLVFYKLDYLSPEDEEKARRQWEDIMEEWPAEVRFVGVFDHAWGTEYNGFIMMEGESMDAYVKFWKWFRDKIRWYVKETKTVIAVKR